MPQSSPERLNEALTIWQQFGPERAIPVKKRWREAFPELDDAAMAEWEALFREVEQFAYAIAERSLRGELDARESCRMIGAAFSWLDDDHIGRLYNQAMSFASR